MEKNISPRKIEANRGNALRSTGPKTPEGKNTVRWNALQHGLLSREVLLQGESKKELIAFGDRLYSELEPVGELEIILVDRLISCTWRLRRVLKAETEFLENEQGDVIGRSGDLSLSFTNVSNLDVCSKLSRYETSLERGFYRALHELERLQARRAGRNVPLPVAVDVDLAVTRIDAASEKREPEGSSRKTVAKFSNREPADQTPGLTGS